MRGAVSLVAGLGLLVAGCSPAALGQTDDFGRRLDQEQREREEERKARAKENAAWLVLDADGCAVRGDPRACGAIERFITEHPESSHVREAAEKLRLGRAAIAETERKVAEEAAAEAERARKTRGPEREAPATPSGESGRVCCCDGTVSPTCTTVKRGCCSHHGGVCACE